MLFEPYGGKHRPLASAPAFIENPGKNRSLGKRLTAAASLSFERGKKELDRFP